MEGYKANKVKSRFLLIKCPRCGKPKVVYGRATLRIKCLKCNLLLVKNGGGKVKIKAPIKKIIENDQNR